MPKVVTFGNRVFTNAFRNLRDDRFSVLHCRRCATYVVITNADTAALPKRATDGAKVLDRATHVVRLNTSVCESAVRVCRAKGFESQYHHLCSHCSQLIAYQCTPPEILSTEDRLMTNQRRSKSDGSFKPSLYQDDTGPSFQRSHLVTPVPEKEVPVSPIVVPRSISESQPLCGSNKSPSSPVGNTCGISSSSSNSGASQLITHPLVCFASSTSSPCPVLSSTTLVSPITSSPSAQLKTRELLYIISDNVRWPRKRRSLDFVCRVCGYVCRDAAHLELHKRQRRHENQEEGTMEDDSVPIPPLIIG